MLIALVYSAAVLNAAQMEKLREQLKVMLGSLALIESFIEDLLNMELMRDGLF